MIYTFSSNAEKPGRRACMEVSLGNGASRMAHRVLCNGQSYPWWLYGHLLWRTVSRFPISNAFDIVLMLIVWHPKAVFSLSCWFTLFLCRGARVFYSDCFGVSQWPSVPTPWQWVSPSWSLLQFFTSGFAVLTFFISDWIPSVVSALYLHYADTRFHNVQGSILHSEN
jgi:hypothetical protein